MLNKTRDALFPFSHPFCKLLAVLLGESECLIYFMSLIHSYVKEAPTFLTGGGAKMQAPFALLRTTTTVFSNRGTEWVCHSTAANPFAPRRTEGVRERELGLAGGGVHRSVARGGCMPRLAWAGPLQARPARCPPRGR